MKGWLLLLSLALVFAGTTCYAESSAFGDDDEWEEVVVKRRKKRTTVAPAPAAAAVVVVAPVAAPTVIEEEEVVSDEPPPPPEPPAADAAEPRRLVRYFCKAWKDKDYERLWWAMSPEYRSEVSLKKFKKLFVSDAELNGGLVDENILETEKTRKGNEGVKVELIFKFPRAQHRFVMAEAERQPGGAFRIVDSPFIPKDLDDL